MLDYWQAVFARTSWRARLRDTVVRHEIWNEKEMGPLLACVNVINPRLVYRHQAGSRIALLRVSVVLNQGEVVLPIPPPICSLLWPLERLSEGLGLWELLHLGGGGGAEPLLDPHSMCKWSKTLHSLRGKIGSILCYLEIFFPMKYFQAVLLSFVD